MNAKLETKYLGLSLKNPLVISSSPLTGRIDQLRQLEDAGAAAAVLPSLFEEQIEHDAAELLKAKEAHTESFAESLTYFPETEEPATECEHYLKLIADAKKAVSMPIIASLNGASPGGWMNYARMLQQAGADAIELNLHFVPVDIRLTSSDVEARYLNLVGSVRKAVDIPLSVKVGPYFSSFGNMAARIVEAGADGLVIFNRFLQPDIDLETLTPALRLMLSDPYELFLPLRWVGILHGHVHASLALSGGLHDADSLVKAVLAGADVGMVASAIYQDGFSRVTKMLKGLEDWMDKNEYESVCRMRGSVSHDNCSDPSAFERGNYMKQLVSFTGVVV